MLGPDTIAEEENRLDALVSQAFSAHDSIAETVSVQEIIEIQTADKNVRVDLEVSKSLEKKRKSRETKETGTQDEDEEAKRERKKRKKEKKEKKHAAEKRHKKEKKTKDTEDNSCTLGKWSPPPISQKTQKIEDDRAVENRFSGNAIHDHLTDRKRRKKEEKKRLKKLEKAQAKDAENLMTHSNRASKFLETNTSGKQTKLEEVDATAPEGVLDEPKKRKKRKHADGQ